MRLSPLAPELLSPRRSLLPQPPSQSQSRPTDFTRAFLAPSMSTAAATPNTASNALTPPAPNPGRQLKMSTAAKGIDAQRKPGSPVDGGQRYACPFPHTCPRLHLAPPVSLLFRVAATAAVPLPALAARLLYVRPPSSPISSCDVQSVTWSHGATVQRCNATLPPTRLLPQHMLICWASHGPFPHQLSLLRSRSQC